MAHNQDMNTQTGSDSAAAQDSSARTLGEFWTELLEKPPAHPGQLLLEAGGNSLVAVMLGNRIELTYGARPSMEQLLSLSFTELCVWCDARRPQ